MLMSMKEILDHASKNNYAVAAPNVFSEFDARAYIEAAEELKAPLILDVTYYAHPDLMFFTDILRRLAQQSSVPVAINLDHGGTKEHIIEAIHAGFTSVMVDRSSCPFDQNVQEVKEIVEIAHACGVSVEAELGHVGMAQSYSEDRDAALTSADDAVRFAKLTGVDCMAVAIGTAHGAYPEGFVPYLDFDRLVEIKKAVNGLPLVLHGSSGTDDKDIEKVCKLGINKINICNDLCRVARDSVRAMDPDGQAAYEVWTVSGEACKKKLKEMIALYGSTGKAWTPEAKGLPKALRSAKGG